MTSRHAVWGSVATFAAAMLFSVNGTVSKLVLQSGLSTQRLVELRCVGAAVCLVLMALAAGPQRLRIGVRELAVVAVFGVVGIALTQWMYFVAIGRLPVGLALLLEFTAPLMILIWIRVVRSTVVSRQAWIAAGVALAGLALVSGVGRDLSLDGVGIAAAMGSAACLASYYLQGEHMLRTRDPLSLTAWAFVAAALFWSALQPWWTFPFEALGRQVEVPGALEGVSAPVWLLCIYIVIGGTVAPFFLALVGVRWIGPAHAGMVGMAEPVGAGLVAWLVLGEVLDGPQLVGAALVLGALVVAENAARAGRRATASPPPVQEGLVV